MIRMQALMLLITANLQAQVWMDQYLITGAYDLSDEGLSMEEVYLPLNCDTPQSA